MIFDGLEPASTPRAEPAANERVSLTTIRRGVMRGSTALLILLLVGELIGLLPWGVLTALSGMGFDAGFSWALVLVMAPFWLYPILILVCAPLAFWFNATGGRTATAATVMLLPVMISGGWFGLVIGVAPFLAKL